MDACPHCGEKSIGLAAKLWSSSTSPTSCRACNGLSYVAGSASADITLGLILLVCAWGALAALLHSSLPLYAVLPSAAWLFHRAWRRAKLLPIDEITATQRRRKMFGFNLLAILLSFFC